MQTKIPQLDRVLAVGVGAKALRDRNAVSGSGRRMPSARAYSRSVHGCLQPGGIGYWDCTSGSDMVDIEAMGIPDPEGNSELSTH